jgi:hypothetical protein
MGDKEKNCCCITGSTDAATEFVESATLLKTLTAIQSLQWTSEDERHDRTKKVTYSKKSFRIWKAPKAGSLRIVCEILKHDIHE